jgi:hypothetical protein
MLWLAIPSGMTTRAPGCGGLLTDVAGTSYKGQGEGHGSGEGLGEWRRQISTRFISVAGNPAYKQ